MRSIALALSLVGLMVAASFVVLFMDNGDGLEPAGGALTRTGPYNKPDPYLEHTGWSTNDMDYRKPVNQRWHNWTNYLQFYPQTEFWFRCKNMTEDYQWLDDINATTSGEEFGLSKEDINLTQTQADPMNFTYPRRDRQMTAKYDTSMNDMGVINLTINPLGLISMGTNPLMGRDKQLMVEVWVDTNGDYDYEDPQSGTAIEGIMRFDFDWWNSPYDPANPGGTIDPYTTNSSEMWKTQRQMEEYMDGIGYWIDIDDDNRPNIPGDITGGRIWVLIWRIDNQPDDYDNRTMDLILYCGYNHKLSWISLPYLHPKQLPVSNTGSDVGFPENREAFLRPISHPDHEDPVFSEINPQYKEGDIILLDGRGSYDPQDDIGADGIAYGDKDWTGADQGEGNENIDNGDPEGEIDYGEEDHLVYKWGGKTSIGGKEYTIILSTGFQKSPLYEWKIRLPAMDPSLPADLQYQIVNITLTVMDPDRNQDTHMIQLLAYKSQNKPQVTLTVVPQIPAEFKFSGESYILPQTEVVFNGYAYDPDPNSELSFEWEFLGPYTTLYFQDTNIITQAFDEAGDWFVKLTVYDGPKDNINTLAGNDTLTLHVVDNIPPVPVIRASFTPPENWVFNQFNTSKNKVVYFNGSLSYDPDVHVPKINNIDEHWQGLPGFDEDVDGIPETPLKYQWEWGDGSRTESFSPLSEAEHKWAERGAAGKAKMFWPVTLKVWDGNAIVTSPEFKVYVNLPPTSEAGPNRPTPDEGEIEVGMPVTFNGIGSYDPNDDPDYDYKRDSRYTDNLLYTWDYGDGSPVESGREVTHIFKKPGAWTVKLTVKDRGVGGYSAEDTCKVRIVPANVGPIGVVKISAESWVDINERRVLTNIPLSFDAGESYDPDGIYYNDELEETSPLDDLFNLTWDLGDGTISKQAKVSHSYADNGEYTVNISMADRKGAEWKETYKIIVQNRRPIAITKDTSLTFFYEDQPIMLSGEGSYDDDGDILGYYWDFGDGTHSNIDQGINGYMPSKVTSHSYEKVGKYTVQLWIMDDDHETNLDDKTAKINVQILPPPDNDEPFPTLEVLAGIGALLVALSVASTFFITLRKRV